MIKENTGVNTVGILLFVVYLLSSVGGMLLVKLGSGSTVLTFENRILQFNMPWYSIMGMVFYIISFILWMVLINVSDLSYIAPIGMGLSQVLIVGAAVFVFKENINIYKGIGIFVVIAGIILMNIKK